MKKHTRLLALALALSGLAAACSSSEATRADLIEVMTSGDQPLTDEQANCVADGIEEAGISFEVANADVDDVSAEDLETMTSITFDGVLGS